jgi:hypothetical protein
MELCAVLLLSYKYARAVSNPFLSESHNEAQGLAGGKNRLPISANGFCRNLRFVNVRRGMYMRKVA